MDRSLFPDGVIVEEGDLKHAETTKAYHIQRRLIDTAQSGRVQGLTVTQGVASTFTISVGRGYTPRGDLIEVTANPPTNVSLTGSEFLLGDYTNGAENLICLHYNEVKELPGSHETAGVSLPRRARGAYDVVVLTPARYDVLPPTSDLALNVAVSDAEYSRLSKDTLLVLAVATATGSGNALTIAVPRSLPADATVSFSGVGYSASILTASEATLSSPSSFIPAAVAGGTSLTIPIPGINLVSIQPVTSGGTPRFGVGYIQVNVSGSTKSVQWLEPSSNQAVGAPVTLNAGLGSQVITINGGASNHTSTLTVEVVHSLLPSANGTYRQYVIVEPLYAETAQVFSSRDEAHRDLKGSYVQTEANPHGLGFKDLAQSLAIVDQPLVLGSNRLSTEAAALVPRITTPVSTAANVDRTLLWLMDRGNYSIRFYRGSFGQIEITANASWNGTQWQADNTTFAATRWTLGSTDLNVATTVGNAPSLFNDSAFSTTSNFSGYNSLIPALAPIASFGSIDAPLTRSRLAVPVPASGVILLASTISQPSQLLPTNPPTFTTPNARLYYSAGDLIFTLNRLFENSAWTRDVASEGEFWINFDTGASPTWSINYALDSDPQGANTGRTLVSGNLLTGLVTFPTGIVLGSSPTFITTAPATTARITIPTTFGTNGGWQRTLLEEIATQGTGAAGTIRRYVATNGTTTYVEDAHNCRWDGSQWLGGVSPFQASLIRKGLSGTSYLFQNAGVGTWNDTGWLSDQTINLSRLAFGGTPLANTLSALNIPKAWGTLTHSNNSTNYTLQGFNVDVSSSSLARADTGLGINFLTNLTDNNYVVIATDTTDRNNYLGNGTPRQMVKVNVVSKYVSGFTLTSYAPQNVDVDHIERLFWNDASAWPANNSRVDFVVFGRQ